MTRLGALIALMAVGLCLGGCDTAQEPVESVPAEEAPAASLASEPGMEKPAAPAEPATSPPAASTTDAPKGKEYVVLTTDHGEIVIELAMEDAPKHAANFRRLVRTGFYNGKGFHRVVRDILVQSGALDRSDPTSETGVPIDPEIKLKHVAGAVGMSRKIDSINPNRKSSGSQFYICLDALPEFDSMGYTVFGKVVKGLDVAKQVRAGNGTNNDLVPVAEQTKIRKAEVKILDIKPDPAPAPAPSARAPSSEEDQYAVLETDVEVGDGKIIIDLFEEKAPGHATNFKKLVTEGFYDGLTFHRVIAGFMAQGGDPKGTGSGGPGYTIPAELGLKHLRGSVAAARTNNPQKRSSGSQFYICFQPQPNLDRMGYSVFGHVVRGMNVVDGITVGRGANGAVSLETRSKIVKAYMVPASQVQPETPSPAK